MPLFEHELRVRLRERRGRLFRADHTIWPNEAGMMLGWMQREPYLRAMLAEIEAAPIDPKQWLVSGGLTAQQINYPDDERERAKVCLALLATKNFIQAGRQLAGSGRNLNDLTRAFVEGVVDPLVNYLEDRIEDGGSVLGVLERYKRRTEWFHQRELHERYHGDTARGEAALDAHLREYLVDQGISFPFSQPRSPSGEADVVALGDEPLALEIKLFLPDAGKELAYVRQGFAQAYRYAHDYNVPAGYLVVFNLSAGALAFPSDHPERWPASIVVGDKTLFCVVVDANPDRPTASKDRKLARHEMDRDYLLAGMAS